MTKSDVRLPPAPSSLCHRCAARRYIKGRASVFVLCTARPEKYPPQPVLRCAEFRPEDDSPRAPASAARES